VQGVFDNAAAFHAAVEVLDPDAAPRQAAVVRLLLLRQRAPAGLRVRRVGGHPGEGEGQEAQILQEVAGDRAWPQRCACYADCRAP